jgi:hypothetical protein
MYARNRTNANGGCKTAPETDGNVSVMGPRRDTQARGTSLLAIFLYCASKFLKGGDA